MADMAFDTQFDAPEAPILSTIAQRLQAGYAKAGRKTAAPGGLIAILMAFLQQFLAQCPTPAKAKTAAASHPRLARLLMATAMRNHGGFDDIPQAVDASMYAAAESTDQDVADFAKAAPVA